MKNIFIKSVVLSTLFLGILVGCTNKKNPTSSSMKPSSTSITSSYNSTPDSSIPSSISPDTTSSTMNR